MSNNEGTNSVVVLSHSEYLKLASFWQILTLAFLISTSTACSVLEVTPPVSMGCKIRTYIDTPVVTYISTRYSSKLPVRVGIIPFDVPENFAPAGEDSLNYGKVLAGKFQRALLQSQEFSIVELFDRDRWPGKRDEFFTGNHQAIQLARNAGYDIVVVGNLSEIVNDSDLILNTKLIDVNTGVTLWFGETTIFSDTRIFGKKMSQLGVSRYEPDKFYFSQRSDELSSCTVSRIVLEE